MPVFLGFGGKQVTDKGMCPMCKVRKTTGGKCSECAAWALLTGKEKAAKLREIAATYSGDSIERGKILTQAENYG